MKPHHLTPLLALAHAQSFQRDPRTASDCISWVDVADNETDTCESTLRAWSVEPVRFHAWNPSVGVNCTPWHSETSYCVLTNATLDDSVFYTTTTMTVEGITFTLPLASLTTDTAGWTIPATRSGASIQSWSTRAPIPSPATWTDSGCFVDTWNDDYSAPPSLWKWILDYRFVPRDPAETLDKCKEKCWGLAYPVAGVKDGNECFCGERNNGTKAVDQAACDTPCGGDGSVICGGRNHTSIWEAAGYDKNGDAATTGGSAAGTVSATGSGSAVSTGAAASTTASSGAARNAVFLGILRW